MRRDEQRLWPITCSEGPQHAKPIHRLSAPGTMSRLAWPRCPSPVAVL